MKVKIALGFFMAIALQAFGQNDSILKYTYEKENIVASAIDGTWKSVQEESQFTFAKDITVLRILSPKFYETFSDRIIYHAGHFSGTVRGREIRNAYFFLAEFHGNPMIVFIGPDDDDTLGHVEGVYVFIAKAVYREDDKLIIAGDHSTDYAKEFIRVE
ncbi:MAG: hypothetical protein AAGD88_08755 [Bacteroidota bacterium]